MGVRIEIGGLSPGKDEAASGCFYLLENGIWSVASIVSRPVNAASNSGPFTFQIPADLFKGNKQSSIISWIFL